MFLFEAGLSIFGIRLYAVCILIGIIIAVCMGVREGKKIGIYSDDIFTGVCIIVPISIIGARLWYILFNLDEGWSFAKIIGLEGGLAGLAIQGGVIAAIISVVVYARIKKISLYKIFDILAPGFLIGQVCGRWGNFFNKELYGPAVKNTELFQILLPKFITENMYIMGDYRHPTFLYESALNLVGLVLILVFRRYYKKYRSGDSLGIYLVWYGIVRIFTESLRADSGANEILMFGPIPVSILVSVIFIIAGVLFLVLKSHIGPNVYYQDILKEIKEKKLDTILFDLDGTLLDTQPLITSSFYYTFNHFYPDLVLKEEDYNSFNGPTLRETFSKYTDDEVKIKEMIKYYQNYNLSHHTTDLVKPFKGCKEILKKLSSKGIKLGIVSSKSKNAVMLGLDLCGLTKYFSVIITGDDVTKHKPDPEGINKAITILKPEANVLYVGDNVSDILAGKNANIKTCSLMYSPKFKECENLNPTYCIEDLYGIYKILDV